MPMESGGEEEPESRHDHDREREPTKELDRARIDGVTHDFSPGAVDDQRSAPRGGLGDRVRTRSRQHGDRYPNVAPATE